MDPQAQKKVIPYDIEKLRGSILKHKENILSFEKAAADEEKKITEEEFMIRELEQKAVDLAKDPVVNVIR